MQYIQRKHTNTHTVNQSVIILSVQCVVFGVRGCCHLKLLPWPGLNLGIRELTNVAYSLVEDAVLLIHHLGQSALLAKVDLKGAYQMVPVHLRNRPYLGSVDAGCFRRLPTPKSLRGVHNIVHYLDDWMIIYWGGGGGGGGAPNSGECGEALRIILGTCQELGVPLSPDKNEGPTTTLTFLGIEVDSSRLQVSLPQDKLACLRAMLQEFPQMKVVRDVRALESLIGHLVHATKVLPLGKVFLDE